MLLVSNVWGGQDSYPGQYDQAIFKIETTEAKLLSQKMHLFQLNKKSDKSLIEMVFRIDDTPELECDFYGESIWERDEKNIMPAEVAEGLAAKCYVLVEKLDPDITPRDAQEPSDICLVLCEEGFFWRAWPGDSANSNIDTEVIPYDVLQRVL